MTNNTNDGPKKPAERGPRKAGASVPARTRAEGTARASQGQAPGQIPPAKPTAARPQTTTNRPTATLSARALSRYEKDQKRQRQLVLATVGVIAFVLLVLAFGIYQTSLAPSFETLANVGGQSISRSEYNKFRKIELFKQSGSIQQQLQFSQGDQQQQLQSQLSLLQDEVLNVGERPVNQTTLENMARLMVLEKAAKDKFGITVSDDDVNRSLGQDFQNIVYTATPNPSQAVQTQTAGVLATAVSGIQTSTAVAITPLPTPTVSVTPATSPNTSPGAAQSPATGDTAAATSLTPGPTSSAAAGASVTASGTVSTTTTVAPSPSPSPTATATAIAANLAQQTAEANQSQYLKSFRTYTDLSDDDYKKYEGRPALIKKKVVEKLRDTLPKVGDTYPLTRVSHILVKEEGDALQILDQLKKTPPDQFESTFIKLAREKSTDTAAAAQNGDLGWISDKTQFDKDFLKAALALDKGKFTDPPVKTQFGYHIIYATDKNPQGKLDALTLAPFSAPDQNGDPRFFGDWLDERVKEATIKYNTPPTPAPTATLVPVPAFTPVVPPTSTPLPTIPPATASVPGTPAATTAAAASPAAATTVATDTTAAAATTAAATTAAPVTTLAATPTP